MLGRVLRFRRFKPAAVSVLVGSLILAFGPGMQVAGAAPGGTGYE